MTLSKDVAAQGGLESVSKAERVASLTGIRAVAALLVMLTHAAYTTGNYTHGYVGLMYSRMEIGVPIFFVLSGFLLFGPWVKALESGGPSPSVRRYAWHRVRRIMPAYAVTVIAAYLLYNFRTAGPNPGHTWMGFLRNLSLTQIYTDHYLFSYLHQGLTQMWSLAVEVAFYVVLPLLAYLLVVMLCRRRWRPVLLLTGLAGLALLTPAWLILVHTTDFLPDGARLWLPTYLSWFIGGMMLAVLQSMGVRAYAMASVPLAVAQGRLLRRDRHADGRAAGAGRPRPVREIPCQPADGLPGRDLLRDLPDPSVDHGTGDGGDRPLSDLHRLDRRRVRGVVRRDSSGRLAAAPVHPRPLRLDTGRTADRPAIAPDDVDPHVVRRRRQATSAWLHPRRSQSGGRHRRHRIRAARRCGLAVGQDAQPGDTIEVTVLGGNFRPPEPAPKGYVIVGDTASLPAITHC